MENEMAMEEWKIDYQIYRKEKNKFDDNWVKAFALIWGNYCSKEVQVRLKEMPDYDGAIRNEPLVLLRHIETLMHTPERAKYPPLTLIEVLLNFLHTKQGENEDLLDYLSRFKCERDVVVRLHGTGIFDGYVEETVEYRAAADDAAKRDLKAQMFNRAVAALFLRNTSQDRFDELLIDCRKAFANKELKYPADLGAMMDVMRQQPIKKKKNPKPSPKNDKKGDDKAKAKEDGDGETSFVQTKKKGDEDDEGYVCYCCGSRTCHLHRCPKKDTLPAGEWYKPEYAKKHQAHTQVIWSDKDEDESRLAFSGIQISSARGAGQPEIIVLDSGSTITLATKRGLLSNIKKCDVTMGTSAGRKRFVRKAIGMNMGDRTSMRAQ